MVSLTQLFVGVSWRLPILGVIELIARSQRILLFVIAGISLSFETWATPIVECWGNEAFFFFVTAIHESPSQYGPHNEMTL